MDPEEDWDEEDWADDGWQDEPSRNRLAEALMVFGTAFPLAVVLVIGLGALAVALIYGTVWLLVRGFAADYGG